MTCLVTINDRQSSMIHGLHNVQATRRVDWQRSRVFHTHRWTTTELASPASWIVFASSSSTFTGNVVCIVYGRVRFSGRDLAHRTSAHPVQITTQDEGHALTR